MKKLLIALALPLWAVQAHGQTFTTYGSSNPQNIDAGYVSDYSANGTVVEAGGSLTMTNGSTYEHGNLSFQNNGSWSSQTGSLDLFAAAGAVAISGSTAPDFFNLQLQNGGAVLVTNTAGANVAGQLSFGTSGIVSTTKANHSNGAIRLADGATYTGGATDAQHVNGYVTKAGNDAFIFPIGSATDLRTLSIAAPATTATISAAWFPGSIATTTDPSDGATHSITSLGAGLQAIYPLGFWDYILTAGDDDGLQVTVSMPNVSAFAVAGDLRLAGWNGTQWIDLSGSGTSGTAENTPLTGTIPAGQTITALAIGSSVPSLPLSVKYGYFHATANGCTTELEWEAHTDAAFRYFSVERSTDGQVFSEAGKVTQATAGIVYTFTDRNPAEGTNYYRIRDENMNGETGYTPTRQVIIHCSDKGTIRVYPTLTTGTVHIDLPGGYERAKITVIGINGQQVPAEVTKDGLTRTARLTSLAAGTYLLNIESNGEIETFKILYQP